MTSRPVFSQLNIVVRDMDAAIRFYRMLGLDTSSTAGEWPPGSGARHVDAAAMISAPAMAAKSSATASDRRR